MRPRLVCAAAAAAVVLPLVVALIALRGDGWHPVLDLAMTELRVRDVFGLRTPLIGLPGRIGEYPDQGSHPGPLGFYLLAPPYRLLGSSAWALQVATVVIHTAAVVTALWIGYRRAGWRGAAAVSAVLAVVVRGYGQLLLTQPWNPYLPLLAWIVVLLAAWAVGCGDTLMVVPLVVAGSFCAQTHVPYLVPAGALTIGALLVAARGNRRHALTGVGLGVALWIPPLVDQVTNDPGNIRKLLDHFTSPPDEALGVVEGGRLALRHLDVWAGFAGQLAGSGRFVSPSSAWRGLLMLLVWLVAAAVAWRFGSRALRALHATVAAALLLGFVSMSRIFGLAWYYLSLWAWGITAVAAGAVVWSALTVSRRFRRVASRQRTERLTGRLAILVAAAASLSSAVAFADADVPEERLSDVVAAVAGPTYAAIAAGAGAAGEGAATGTGGVYVVRWSDAADIGSPGIGLLNELERRGLDVIGDEFWRTPLTAHRTAPRSAATAQIHLATGGYVARWRAVTDAVEVAMYEPRSAAERALYRRTRAALIERLGSEGLDEIVPLVDTNLFGGSLDQRISAADLADFELLLELGQPTSVFIAPACAEPGLPDAC